MNVFGFIKKLFIIAVIISVGVHTSAIAEDFYTTGMSALSKNDYTNAIEYLKKALVTEPQNTSILNNLAVAYTARGTNYYNKDNNLELAANDYRNAIYYLEFYNKSANTPTMNQNIPIAHQNLRSVLEAQKFKTDSANRLKKAKELRGKGEFTEAVVEYYFASKDRKYAYESYVAIGDIMKNLNNEYSAAIYYDKALAQNDSDPYLHLKFGRTLYKLGNVDTAVRELDIAMENSKTKEDAIVLLESIWKDRVAKRPSDPVAQMNLGAVYQNKGQYDLAMSQYKIAQNLDPKNQMIRLNIATLYQQQGNYQEALNIYNSILRTRPNDVMIKTYKAATLYKMGQKDMAISIYQDLLQNNPNNKEIKENLIDAISSSSNNAAITYYASLTEKFPADEDFAYNYAYALHKDKKYSEAIVQYEKTLSLNAQNVDAYLNMISIYRIQDNQEKLLETLNKAKVLFPNNEKIAQMLNDYNEEIKFNLMAKAAEFYNAKDYNSAISVYKSVQNPTEEVYLGIGACYQAMNKYDDAIMNYNKAVSMDASNPNAHYFLGLAYLYKKDYAKAELSLKKAMELDDINPDIKDAYKSLKFEQSEQFMNAGIKLFENNKNDEAIKSFDRAITTCSENGYAYYYRGLAYDTKGQNSKAISDYKKAIELSPELTMAYYSMALSYDAMDNKIEAKKMYQKFIKENPENDEYTQYSKQRVTEL